MLSAALDRLRAELPEDAPPQVVDGLTERLSTVYLGSRWEGRTVHAVLPRGARTPIAILKIDTHPRYQPRLRREHRALRHYASFPRLRGRMPAPLGLYPFGDALVLAQTAQPGVPLNVLLRRRVRHTARRSARDHAQLLDWLAALHGGADRVAAPLEPELVDERLALALPPELPGRTAFLRTVAAMGRDLGPLAVPSLPVHGDLAPSNCLVHRDRMGVIDWEGAVADGSPLADIVLFLNHYARALTGGGTELAEQAAAFRRAFLDSGWLGELTRATWRRELDVLGFPGDADEYLLVATVADLAGGHAPTAHARRKGARRNWTELLACYVTDRTPGATQP